MRIKKKQKRHSGRVIAWMLLLITLAGAYNYLRPLPALTVTPLPPLTQESTNATMPWPSDAVAAIGAVGYGVLASSQTEEKTIPTASLAKVITALAVLKEKPLVLNQQGPTITLTQEDVQSYNDYYAKGGSITLVANGEKITQYQALQSILLPSSNNMADTLAKWAFGSLEGYSTYANNYVKQLGLKHTTVGTDASGLSPTTVSTPSDLVKLGEIALQHPVIAQIVAQPNANVPVAGTIPNVNRLLGHEGVNGIKTGNSDEARGCIMFSANYEVAPGHHVTILGVVMAAPSVNSAIADSLPLLRTAKQYFSVESIVRAGESFGTVYVPWAANSTVHALAQHDSSAVTWQRSVSPVAVRSAPLLKIPAKAGDIAGSIGLQGGTSETTIPLQIDRPVEKPGFWWRLIRW